MREHLILELLSLLREDNSSVAELLTQLDVPWSALAPVLADQVSVGHILRIDHALNRSVRRQGEERASEYLITNVGIDYFLRERSKNGYKDEV